MGLVRPVGGPAVPCLPGWQATRRLVVVSVVTVSIGRCVGSVPMPEARWRAFRDAVRFALSGCECTVFVDGASSVGRWTDEGTGSVVSEDSATWVAECGRPELLSELLSVLAGQYGQDAIALTVGQTTLCRSSVHSMG